MFESRTEFAGPVNLGFIGRSRSTQPERDRRTFRALRIRDFRLYFFAQLCSTSGTNAQTVAVGWLVLQLSDSGSALGLVVAAEFLPLLLVSPLLGAVVDRFDKRRLLLGTQSGAIVVTGALATLAWSDRATVLGVGILALLLGLVNAVDYPARQTFVRDMVGIELLSNAVALNNVLRGVARIAGPAVAGVMIAFVGVPACFLLNSASFVVGLLAVWAIRSPAGPDRPRESGPATVRSGFRYVVRTPEVRSSLIIMAFVGTFTYEFWVTVPVLARDVFDQGASGYASMMTVMSVGSVVGGLAMARRTSVDQRALLFAVAGFGLTTVAVGVSPTVVVAFVAILFMGFAYSGFVVLSNSVLQLSTARLFQGRVMALWTAAFAGSTAVGGPIMGWIIDLYGVRVALVVGGLVAVATACGFGLRRGGKSEELSQRDTDRELMVSVGT